MSPPAAVLLKAETPRRSAISSSSNSRRSYGSRPCSRARFHPLPTATSRPGGQGSQHALHRPLRRHVAGDRNGREDRTAPVQLSLEIAHPSGPRRDDAVVGRHFRPGPNRSPSGDRAVHQVRPQPEGGIGTDPPALGPDGGPPTTRTSAVRISRDNRSRPGSELRSAVTLRLPRSHSGAAASDRKRSPPGGSILITSAPKSASTMVAIPPTGPVVTSMTRKPSSTCGMAESLSQWLPARASRQESRPATPSDRPR